MIYTRVLLVAFMAPSQVKGDLLAHVAQGPLLLISISTLCQLDSPD